MWKTSQYMNIRKSIQRENMTGVQNVLSNTDELDC